MAEHLFQIDRDFKIILNPEAVKIAGGSLKGISQKTLRYIILAYDYRVSKFKLFPEETMIRLAKSEVYGKGSDFVPEDDPKIMQQIKEYRSLIYDENRETKKTFQKRIDTLRKELVAEGDLTITRLKSIRETISYLTEQVAEIDKQISADDEELVLKGRDTKLSMIEIWQRRKLRSDRMEA